MTTRYQILYQTDRQHSYAGEWFQHPILRQNKQATEVEARGLIGSYSVQGTITNAMVVKWVERLTA